MKSLFHKIIILGTCLSLFVIGAGYTTITYCCNNHCSQEKDIYSYLYKAGDHCTDTSQHDCCSAGTCHKSGETTEACSHNHHEHEKCCYSESVFIDLDSYSSKLQLSIPFLWIDSLYFSEYISESFFQQDYFPDPLSKILISPRTYLSLIRVLII